MKFRKQKDKRTPLAEPSLPQPGDSGVLELWDLIGDMMLLGVLPFALLCMSVVEWMHYFVPGKPRPLIPTVGFLLVLGFAVLRGRQAFRRLDSLVLGIQGERAVGQMLEKMRRYGYHVFHDLSEDGYNIDHVLIGLGGIFAIETKTRSKPRTGNVKVVVDGEKLTVAGLTPDRDPIAQAEGAARRVKNIILAQSGQEIDCVPVVIFPGWYVETLKPPRSVRVMSDKYFAKWFPDRPTRLSRAQIAFFAAGLERYLKERRTN
jgi:hypothetical protein